MTREDESPAPVAPVSPTKAKKRSQPRKSTAKTSATTQPEQTREATDGANAAAVSGRSDERHARTATVNLPFVTAEFRAPEVHLPSVPHPTWRSVPLMGRLPQPHVPEAAGRQVSDVARVVGSHLPEREQLALFAGLGAVAVAGVIDWPVAAAVAAATVVAKRARRSPGESASRQARPATPADAS